jgi:hypothetical protein
MMDDERAVVLAQHEPSALMREAIACLAGRRRWTGCVTGCWGLLNRPFEIESEGESKEGSLTFRETLRFYDGKEERREWRIFEHADALRLVADGVRERCPARIEDGALVFDYSVRFGLFRFNYRDEFRLEPGGVVDNRGRASLFGVCAMRVRAEGRVMR